MEATSYRRLICTMCAWIYDEQEGAPSEGIPAGMNRPGF